MEYFVSIENKPYHAWQIDLLIESFKLHNLQDKLVIAVASNDNPYYFKNMNYVKKVFVHDNIGKKRGFLPLNKIYSCYVVQQQKILTQPFTIIDPDMLLYKPITSILDNINFQTNPILSLDFIEENHCFVKNHIKKIADQSKNQEINNFWIPLSSVYAFKDVPLDFFARAIEWTEILEYERLKRNNQLWWHTDKVGWALAMMECIGFLTLKSENSYEMTFYDHLVENNFIHYNLGIPGIFNKKMFSYNEEISLGNPMEILLNNNPTSTTDYTQRIVKNYLKEFGY